MRGSNLNSSTFLQEPQQAAASVSVSGSNSNQNSNPMVLLRRNNGSYNHNHHQQQQQLVTGAAPQTQPQPRRARSNTQSDFDVSLMPRDKIVRRTLSHWSVHHSLTTSRWIATVSRPEYASVGTHQRAPQHSKPFFQMPFSTERQARKFCKAYAPPKLTTTLQACGLCQTGGSSNSTTPQRHCRNCGVTVCDRCSCRWHAGMVPKTFMNIQTTTVRVCKSCDWLSNAFCMALLRGRYHDALEIHETGNVNLRTTFADIRGEAMFPIHCAVMGGSIECLRWLVDTHLCPISVSCDAKGAMLSIQSSGSRTLLDMAMTGRPKVDILVYLVKEKGLSIQDVKDKALIPKTLDTLLRIGSDDNSNGTIPNNTMSTSPPLVDTNGRIVGHNDVHLVDPQQEDAVSIIEDQSTTTVTIEDACHICFERPMDCVMTPCGHQVCCSDCGLQLTTCPICKAASSVLKIFRQ